MSLEPRLAWRNIWRNPRRTALSVAATVFAVVLVVVFVAMAAGVHEKMVEDAVRIHSGHVTINAVSYREKETLDQYVVESAELVAALDDLPARGWAPRVVSFALVSRDSVSQGVVVIGVDPEREGSVTTLPDRIVRGRFLGPPFEQTGGREIVLGRRLAESLGAQLGDELLVYGVAYSLETAYELFTVVGLVALPEPQLERSLALIHLRDAQAFYVYDDKLSEIALLAADADDADPLRDAVVASLASLDAELDVSTWDELMPELVQFILLDDAGMYVLLLILIVVVGFGILNTILMAILERTRELGVAMALGLRPISVFRMVYLESMFLAGVGLAIGFVISIPIVLYMQAHPIPLSGSLEGVMELIGFEPVITFKLKPMNPIGSVLTIFGVASAASLYPAIKASRGRPVDSLRSI